MRQAKITLTEEQLSFLDRHRALGFRDRSELVRTALERFRADIHARQMEASAALYAEIYDEDQDLQALTEAASAEWPT